MAAGYKSHSGGSSPHTRGARGTSCAPARSSRDHPRIRGEHLVLVLVRAEVARIIPAYAGSTLNLLRERSHALWIIPAYAGSTPFAKLFLAYVMGSSPHTRGARRTPRRCTSPSGDHPRIRGEHPVRAPDLPSQLGIIPAYAGSTLPAPLRTTWCWGSSPHTRGALLPLPLRLSVGRDHPRIRGEHLLRACAEQPVRGIIPAYAGSTWPVRVSLHTPPWIIPAYAGSTGVDMAWFKDITGSSPHTRGAPVSAPPRAPS